MEHITNAKRVYNIVIAELEFTQNDIENALKIHSERFFLHDAEREEVFKKLCQYFGFTRD